MFDAWSYGLAFDVLFLQRLRNAQADPVLAKRLQDSGHVALVILQRTAPITILVLPHGDVRTLRQLDVGLADAEQKMFRTFSRQNVAFRNVGASC